MHTGPKYFLVSIIMAAAVMVTAGLNTSTVKAAEPPAPAPSSPVVSMTPQRAIDTREASGDNPAGKIPTGQTLLVPLLGQHGLPSVGVAAVMLNVTVTEPVGPGFLTVYPSDANKPTASSMNYETGETIANQVIVAPGDAGMAAIYAHAGTHVVVDVTGYIKADPSFTAFSPTRLLDTRAGIGAPTAPVAEGTALGLQVTGRGGVPDTGVTGVVLTVTATGPTRDTYLTVYPADKPRPTASNLNLPTGSTRASLALATPSADGVVNIYSHATTELVADVVGFFTADSGFTPVGPQRLLDSRATQNSPVAANAEVTVDVTAAGSINAPAGATVWLNVTSVNSRAPGYVTVFPTGAQRPLASTLNYRPGDIVANSIMAKVGTNGSVSLYTMAASDLVVDIAGVFPALGEAGQSGLQVQPPPVTSVAAGGPVRGGFTVADGVAPYRFEVTDGALPPGVRLTEAGRFAGSSIVPGRHQATVSVTDSTGQSGVLEHAITVTAGPEFHRFKKVTSGPNHNCGVGTDGQLWCWGSNDSGELGVDSQTPQENAARSVTNLRGVTDVAVGEFHTCAVAGGEVWCWGDGDRGRTGRDAAIKQLTPKKVAGVSGATAVVAGSDHSCALAGGDVWCWGDNTAWQLGVTSGESRSTPGKVPGVAGVNQLTAGMHHTCAVSGDGVVRCWGRNAEGQMGTGTATQRRTPTVVPNIPKMTQVTAGIGHNCALTTAGQVWCWGWNAFGQVGSVSPEAGNVRQPRQVADIPPAKAVTAGGWHSCATTTDGALWCWGDNLYGQRGVGGGDATSVAAQVPGVGGVLSVAASWSTTCAVLPEEVTSCWGDGDYGRLGDWDGVDRSGPSTLVRFRR